MFDYIMNESRRLDTIEMLRIHTSIQKLSKWFRINYLSKVFDNKIKITSFENWERQCVLDTIAESDRFNKKFPTVLQKWVVENHQWLQMSIHDNATIWHYNVVWTARLLRRLIYSKNLAAELQFLNLALASLRLAWNISGMKNLNFQIMNCWTS